LYDRSQEDFINFTAGKLITKDEVLGDIGHTETWTHRAEEYPEEGTRTPEQTSEIALLMNDCYNWTPSENYIDRALPT